MSASIPYHLRFNKAIDRKVFLEFLNRSKKHFDYENLTYIGMGGSMFEDFKLIHSIYTFNKYISIESNKKVIKRQEFNKPFNCIECVEKTTTDFIDEYTHEEEVVIWLDYQSPDIGSQLCDVESIISKLAPGSIVKITMNANPDSLYKPATDEPLVDALKKRLNAYKYKVDDKFINPEIKNSRMDMKGLPLEVLFSLNIAISEGLAPYSDIQFNLVNGFVYRDGQQMITITGVLIEPKSEPNFVADDNIKNWEFYLPSWDSLTEISVPELTLKEKIMIDQCLPCGDFDAIKDEIMVADTNTRSAILLDNYKKFYKHYPAFHKLAV